MGPDLLVFGCNNPDFFISGFGREVVDLVSPELPDLPVLVNWTSVWSLDLIIHVLVSLSSSLVVCWS